MDAPTTSPPPPLRLLERPPRVARPPRPPAPQAWWRRWFGALR